MNKKKYFFGFTLMELMIAIAIIGILAAIAVPSYVEYVNRSRRTDAKTVLLQAAQWMERRRAESTPSAYTCFANGAFVSPSSGAVQYTINCAVAGTGGGFTLTATRAATGIMASDGCGNFTIDNTGARNLVGNTAGFDIERCWGR